jgi:hypothetical protein
MHDTRWPSKRESKVGHYRCNATRNPALEEKQTDNICTTATSSGQLEPRRRPTQANPATAHLHAW